MMCNKCMRFDVSRMMFLLVLTNASFSRNESRHASYSIAFELACAMPLRRLVAEVHHEPCMHSCMLQMLHFLRMLMLRLLGVSRRCCCICRHAAQYLSTIDAQALQRPGSDGRVGHDGRGRSGATGAHCLVGHSSGRHASMQLVVELVVARRGVGVWNPYVA